MKKLILASSSPRRVKLLQNLGLKLRIIPPQIKERINLSLSPIKNTKRLSQLKASDVAEKVSQGLVIAADTLVVLKRKILGKPKTLKEARQMLAELSGREHQVITTITIIDTASKKLKQKTVVTKVKFKKLNQAVIEKYLSQVNPLDKAGGYAIQEKGNLLIESIKGDYHNVMGLPLNALNQLLRELGIQFKIPNRNSF